MRLALLISGYVRGLRENIDSFYRNIIQGHQCDIYIHVTDDKDKYYNMDVDINYINAKLKPKVIICSKNLQFPGSTADAAIYNQNYKYYWLFNEMKRIADIECIQYDIVIKLRPDIHMLEPLDFNSCEPDCIYIPKDAKMDMARLVHPKYLCDMIAYGGPMIMEVYFDLYKHLDRLISLYGHVNETLMYYYMEDKNYREVDIEYIVVLSLCNTIAITGDSGSGKTTLSRILQELLTDSCFVLECDRYHKWERNNDNWKKYTHLDPDANYLTKMQRDVFDLKLGNTIYQVDYDHKRGVFTDQKCIESMDNIIICGLHSLYLPDGIANLKVYMETDDSVRIPNKIRRDVKVRNYTVEDIYMQIMRRTDDFNKYIYPQRKVADIIIHLYTDKQFSIETFNIDEELEVHCKIGVRDGFDIHPILGNISYNYTVERCDGFIYMCFGDYNTGIPEVYSNIIKQVFGGICRNK